MDDGDDASDFLPLPSSTPSKSPKKPKSPTPAKKAATPKKAAKKIKVEDESNDTSTARVSKSPSFTSTTPATPIIPTPTPAKAKPKPRAKKAASSDNGDSTQSTPHSKSYKGKGAHKKGDKGDNNKDKVKRDKNVKRPIPYFKTIPGTEFLVDAFTFKNENCKHYFLTHFHSDHYTGISKGWHHGVIYCTPITSKLLQHKIGVSPEYIQEIPLDIEVSVLNAQVCMLDANHCPGAAMILFKVNGSTILHTGDFRYDPKMQLYKTLRSTKVDVLYLDNTFCNPKFTFPAQPFVVNGIADLVQRELQTGNTLVLIGSYVIGKERVLIEVARRCNVKIFVPQDKYEILSKLEIDMSIFTVYPGQTPVHCVRMNLINYPGLAGVYQSFKNGYNRVVGIMPTGWSQSRTPISRRDYPNFSIVSAAYSEHSSYTELVKCVEWLKPAKIVPTVDCNTPQKIKEILSHFKDKMDNSRNLNTLFPYFAPKSAVTKNPPSISLPASTPSKSSQPKTDEFEMDDIDRALLQSLLDENGTPYECGCDSEPEIDDTDWGDGDTKKKTKKGGKKAKDGKADKIKEEKDEDEKHELKITPKQKSPSSSSFSDWEALSEATSSGSTTTTTATDNTSNTTNTTNTTTTSTDLDDNNDNNTIFHDLSNTIPTPSHSQDNISSASTIQDYTKYVSTAKKSRARSNTNNANNNNNTINKPTINTTNNTGNNNNNTYDLDIFDANFDDTFDINFDGIFYDNPSNTSTPNNTHATQVNNNSFSTTPMSNHTTPTSAHSTQSASALSSPASTSSSFSNSTPLTSPSGPYPSTPSKFSPSSLSYSSTPNKFSPSSITTATTPTSTSPSVSNKSISPSSVSPTSGAKRDRDEETDEFDVHSVNDDFIQKQKQIEQTILYNNMKGAPATRPISTSASNLPVAAKSRSKIHVSKVPAKKSKQDPATNPQQPSLFTFFQAKSNSQ